MSQDPTTAESPHDKFLAALPRLFPRLVAQARSIVRCPHVAEDVVQEAVLDVLRALGRSAFEERDQTDRYAHVAVTRRARRCMQRRSASTSQVPVDPAMHGLAARPDHAWVGAVSAWLETVSTRGPHHELWLGWKETGSVREVAARFAGQRGFSQESVRLKIRRHQSWLVEALGERFGIQLDDRFGSAGVSCNRMREAS